MKLKICLLNILLLICLLSTAQRVKISKYKVGISPALVLLPKIIRGIQPSVQIKIANRLAWLTEMTLPLKSSIIDSSSLHSKYFRVKQELKYFLTKNQNESVVCYAGLQLSYSFRSFDDASKNGGAYFDEKLPDSCYYSYSSAHINSPIFTTTLQLGFEGKITKKISMDLFGGVGLRSIHTNYSDITNQQYQTNFIRWRSCGPISSIRAAYQFVGTINRVQFNAGFRFFYAL